jgi:hypothetical protein
VGFQDPGVLARDRWFGRDKRGLQYPVESR